MGTYRKSLSLFTTSIRRRVSPLTLLRVSVWRTFPRSGIRAEVSSLENIGIQRVHACCELFTAETRLHERPAGSTKLVCQRALP